MLQITILTYSTLSKQLFQFLCVFTKQLQGITITFITPVWQLSTWKNSASSGQTFLKLYTGDSYSNLLTALQFN